MGGCVSCMTLVHVRSPPDWLSTPQPRAQKQCQGHTSIFLGATTRAPAASRASLRCLRRPTTLMRGTRLRANQLSSVIVSLRVAPPGICRWWDGWREHKFGMPCVRVVRIAAHRGSLANLCGRPSVEAHLTCATPAILAIKFHAESRAGDDLANRLALLCDHDLVALLRECDLNRALWLRCSLRPPRIQLPLTPCQVCVPRISNCGACLLLLPAEVEKHARWRGRPHGSSKPGTGRNRRAGEHAVGSGNQQGEQREAHGDPRRGWRALDWKFRCGGCKITILPLGLACLIWRPARPERGGAGHGGGGGAGGRFSPASFPV